MIFDLSSNMYLSSSRGGFFLPSFCRQHSEVTLVVKTPSRSSCISLNITVEAFVFVFASRSAVFGWLVVPHPVPPPPARPRPRVLPFCGRELPSLPLYPTEQNTASVSDKGEAWTLRKVGLLQSLALASARGGDHATAEGKLMEAIESLEGLDGVSVEAPGGAHQVSGSAA